MKSGAAKIQIQRATGDDARLVESVLWQAFAEFESLYTRQAFVATIASKDVIQARMHEGPVWCAACHGRIVGTAAAVQKQDGVYVRGMAVIPAARGFGVGRLLLQEAEAFAAANNCRRLFLSTTPFLIGAILLYERFGFQRIEAGPHDLFGTPLFTMEKRLPNGTTVGGAAHYQETERLRQMKGPLDQCRRITR